VIDVLAPSYEGVLISNQKHGQIVVDEIPGLHTALHEPATVVDVTAVLTDGTEVQATLHLPDVAAALTMKAHAYRGRLAKSDAIDIHRLLEADEPRRSHCAGLATTERGARRREDAA
jgi:hypothetical protein